MRGGITILSPHRDDAAFSLCLCMLRWSERGMPIRVATFFTCSAYAPRATIPESGSERPKAISVLRRKEDRAALFGIHHAIREESFNFVDAPLRLGIEPNAVCTQAARQLPDENTIEQLRAKISPMFRQQFVLAPLGLGDHVDHLAVRSAAIASHGLSYPGFYEDLPYAMWTSEEALQQRVRECEKRGIHLRPIVIRTNHAIWKKRVMISRYRSQITAAEAKAISDFASRYGGGERIWIPKHSKSWQMIAGTRRALAG